jgi:phosphotransferase system HPr (HPr) family protein
VKRAQVIVPWQEGLHLRPAAKLVRLAQTFRASLSLKCDRKVANLRSILSLMTLCAAVGTLLEIEAAGDDEQEALGAVERAFSPDGHDESLTAPP